MIRPLNARRASPSICSMEMEKAAVATRLDFLVRAVRAGDSQRFGEVVSLLQTGVRSILAVMIPDTSLVPDLAHETFVVAYMKLDEYQEGTDFPAWVKTIARNLASNERRRWIRERRFTSRYATAIDNRIVGPMLDELTEKLELEQQTQLLASLNECLAELSPGARKTVELFYLKGQSVADIAASSGRSTGATKSQLFRARAALAECLAAKGWLRLVKNGRVQTPKVVQGRNGHLKVY